MSNVASPTPHGQTNDVDSLFGDEKLETIVEEVDQIESDASPKPPPSIDVTSLSETMLVENVDTSYDDSKKGKKTKIKKTTVSGGATKAVPKSSSPTFRPAKMISTTYVPDTAVTDTKKLRKNGNEETKFDKCAGIDGTYVKRPLQSTIFTKLAEEKFKVRRIRRKAAKPTPTNAKPKMTKTSDLRQRYIRNEDVVAGSSVSEEHMRKFKKPPFKRIGVIQKCYEKLCETLEKVKIKKKKTTTKSGLKSRQKIKSKKRK